MSGLITIVIKMYRWKKQIEEVLNLKFNFNGLMNIYNKKIRFKYVYSKRLLCKLRNFYMYTTKYLFGGFLLF